MAIHKVCAIFAGLHHDWNRLHFRNILLHMTVIYCFITWLLAGERSPLCYCVLIETTLCDCNWIWNMDLLGIMEDSVNVGVQMVDTTPGRDFPDSRKPVVSEVKPQSKCWKFSRNGLQERPVLPTRVMWGAWCLPGKPEDHKTLNLMERGSLRVSILIYLLGVFMGNWKMVSRNLICIFSNVCLIEIGPDFLVSKQMHFCSLII